MIIGQESNIVNSIENNKDNQYSEIFLKCIQYLNQIVEKADLNYYKLFKIGN